MFREEIANPNKESGTDAGEWLVATIEDDVAQERTDQLRIGEVPGGPRSRRPLGRAKRGTDPSVNPTNAAGSRRISFTPWCGTGIRLTPALASHRAAAAGLVPQGYVARRIRMWERRAIGKAKPRPAGVILDQHCLDRIECLRPGFGGDVRDRLAGVPRDVAGQHWAERNRQALPIGSLTGDFSSLAQSAAARITRTPDTAAASAVSGDRVRAWACGLLIKAAKAARSNKGCEGRAVEPLVGTLFVRGAASQPTQLPQPLGFRPRQCNNPSVSNPCRATSGAIGAVTQDRHKR